MKNIKKYLLRLSITFLLTISLVSPSIGTLHIVNAANVQVSSPKISKSKIAIAVGEKATLEFENATKLVTWKSEDKSIANVNEYGEITAISEGVTQIFATHDNVVYPCRVTVYKERLQTLQNEYFIYEDTNIPVTFLYKKSYETIQVSSSNPEVASIGKIAWDGNIANLPISIGKKGSTVLTIKRTKSVEPCTITIHVIDKSERIVPDATEIYEKVAKSMVEITMVTDKKEDSLGSGFFIGDGMILTNYHVIENASSINVIDYEGKEFEVTSIYDYNKEFDLAVLGVKGTKEALPISLDKVVAGEKVYTVGSPYGYTGTFSSGIVGAASRIIEKVDYIQITAPISKGNSGGPLLNRFGEVIGVNTLTRTDAQNLNFSLNISYLKQLDLSTKKDIKTFLK
ncbi:S1C family serine protease [Clostridium sp. Marseille-P299]|uniref:S1C family serine protease n=1 Tax=Clostridium sp. Marseille-P299 TaxID=1805477 RepID=UPI00082F6FF4|nr:trypsin-like peptidase domain-containing protein [Clostridium sp. Marseille-P299]